MNLLEFEEQNFVTVVNTSLSSNIELFINHLGYEKTKIGKEKVVGTTSYTLFFIVEGTILFNVNNKQFKLDKGHCFVLDPSKKNSYIPYKDKQAKYYWISLTGKSISQYLTQMGFDLNVLYLKISTITLNQIRKVLFNNFQISQQDKKIVDFYFMESFFNIAKLIFNGKNTASSQKTNTNTTHIENALLYINDHYTESTFSLKELATHLFLHENYLSSLFKSTMGISFKEYVNQKRIQRAIALIKNNVSSVTEIANSVGIPDISYFSKVFKKYNSITASLEIKQTRKL